jgi:hypothetical protein
MRSWQEELGAQIVHWRCTRDRIKGKYYGGRGYHHFFKTLKPIIQWDDFKVVGECAKEFDMQLFLYVSLFDEGWPLLPKRAREVSYHNSMHCQHVSWQSEFSRSHPEFALVDRTLRQRQWGVLCLAYPEVREHFIQRYLRLLGSGNFDGLFVCLRSQSRPAEFADQFGFNKPVREAYLEKHGRDICKEDFDLQLWRDLLGENLTAFLFELRESLRVRDLSLAVGVARGMVIGPPLGNATLQWARWVNEAIVDQLIVDQNSSQCPSMWHQLWPMHRGYGYLQNYLDGFNTESLEEGLDKSYAPVFQGQPARLYVARQWQERSEPKERALLRHPAVSGLVFSSFRHDNPGPVSRNDWTA